VSGSALNGSGARRVEADTNGGLCSAEPSRNGAERQVSFVEQRSEVARDPLRRRACPYPGGDPGNRNGPPIAIPEALSERKGDALPVGGAARTKSRPVKRGSLPSPCRT
jgi:hypothetical protein